MDLSEQKLQQSLKHLARRAAARGEAVPGCFLPVSLCGMAVHEAHEAGVMASFDGGYPGAERVQVCFTPPGAEPVFSAIWMEARWDTRFADADHRALLGSLMALGIDRNSFGDLIAGEGTACLPALPELAARLPMEWTQAGRTPLKTAPMAKAPRPEPDAGENLRITTASLRLDAVLAAALHLSRAAACELIRRGEVQVDHRPEARVDRMLTEGSLLSVRGYGRVRIVKLGEENRHGRLVLTLGTQLKPR